MSFGTNNSEIFAFPQTMLNGGSNKLGYNLPIEEMYLVHPHWLEYQAPPYFLHLLLAMVYIILMFTSLTGNGIVIWIFSTSKSLRTASNMLILNLAVFDLVMMLEMPMFVVNSFSERLIGSDVGCGIYAALGSVSGMGGSITNAVIAFDRYKTISSPLDGRLNRAQARFLILLTWLWTIPFTVLPMFKIWGRYIPEGFLTTCSFDYLTDDQETKVFVGCIFAWAYAIPMCLICFFYFQLFGHVQQHEAMLKNQAKKMNVKSLASNQDNQKSIELRVAKAAFTIFFLFVCAWTPYAVVTMIGAFGNRQLLTPLTTMLPSICAKIVSCLDPWIYAISHPRYRAELEKRIPWLGIRETLNESTVSTQEDERSVTTTVPE